MSTNKVYRMIRIGGPPRPPLHELLTEALGVQNKSDVHMLVGMARAMISSFPRYRIPVSVDTSGFDPAVETLIECAEMISDEGLSVLIKEARQCTPKTTAAKVFEFPSNTAA